MGGRHVVVAEAHPVEGAGLEVLGDDVGLAGEAQHELATARVLQVDADAPLVQVVAQERRPHLPAGRIGHGRERTSAQVAVDRVLDLDDVGAQPGQQLGGEGERLHLLEGEHADTVERLAVGRRRFVGHFAQSHAATVI